MKHLYLTEDGLVKDAPTSITVGTWQKCGSADTIHIFLPDLSLAVEHERPATHKSVMKEHWAEHRRPLTTVRYNPKTMRFETRIIG